MSQTVTTSPVPPPGEDRRAWIRYQLRLRANEATGKRWTQNDVAKEAHVNESTVSNAYLGTRTDGRGTQKVMRITARILEMTTDELFGVSLEAGDGYRGSPIPAETTTARHPEKG